ncbi:hypothetical protein M8756_15165 [Lutimaribacter sp. EGI FJ00015]|uniref:Uncharacterized protein n=1 Tax=Lutimaribacter degradans TaxID=2945989 RepID=A0ACC5ZYQ7_9RHOB|nr:hypothetical protein [Lutimaribacter sp. EGI FJ00013]MCM2563479.1 hypothetical protein [Lutimaribacter sp. EGI FJ00013]MCO0614659.1 hypothetical protein [Lutimaribacter sp. EGI FJ00015]
MNQFLFLLALLLAISQAQRNKNAQNTQRHLHILRARQLGEPDWRCP